MTKKKQDKDSSTTDAAGSQPDIDQSGEEKTQKRAKARRLVLKSIVTGGAVTTTKTLPDKWTRPITDSVLMPAHAQASPTGPVTLACRVLDVDSVPQADGDADGLSFDPAGPPFSGGANVTVDGFFDASSSTDSGTDDVEITLGGVSATLDPAAAGDVTLSLSTDGDFDLDTAGPFDVDPNGSGVATFPDINGDLLPSDGVSSGDLELRFSAPGADDCVISFTFVEDGFTGDLGP